MSAIVPTDILTVSGSMKLSNTVRNYGGSTVYPLTVTIFCNGDIETMKDTVKMTGTYTIQAL